MGLEHLNSDLFRHAAVEEDTDPRGLVESWREHLIELDLHDDVDTSSTMAKVALAARDAKFDAVKAWIAEGMRIGDRTAAAGQFELFRYHLVGPEAQPFVDLDPAYTSYLNADLRSQAMNASVDQIAEYFLYYQAVRNEMSAHRGGSGAPWLSLGNVRISIGRSNYIVARTSPRTDRKVLKRFDIDTDTGEVARYALSVAFECMVPLAVGDKFVQAWLPWIPNRHDVIRPIDAAKALEALYVDGDVQPALGFVVSPVMIAELVLMTQGDITTAESWAGELVDPFIARVEESYEQDPRALLRRQAPNLAESVSPAI